MARILHITDPHIAAPPALVSGRLDTAALLRRAVGRIAASMPRIGPIDALLVTGDVSDDGTAESYALFREILAPLALPTYVVPGNHDRREPMRAAFADLGYLPARGRLDWEADVAGMRLVGLDTLVEGQGGGRLEAGTLAFLDAALEEARDRPVLLALHHPPFASGIRFMDAIGLEGAEALRASLERVPNDIRILCGHVHNAITGAVGRVPALSGPSLCSTFEVDFRPEAPVGFLTQPGGYMLHDWDNGFRSILTGLEQADGPHPF